MRISFITILAASILSSCSSEQKNCLPEGETATVVETVIEKGGRFVIIERKNGQKVKCIGRTTPIILQHGDKVDGVGMDLVEIVED